MSAVSPNNRTRFKRLRVAVDASLHTSTASIATVTIDNHDSGGNITSRPIDQLDLLLNDLGFDTPQFDFTAPAQ